VRPEKIGFGPAGSAALPASVTSRVFQGNHWLYQFDTPLGTVLVIRQNDGGLQPAAGESVNLVWRAEDMRAVPGDSLAQT
jgi:putative spermidine/putrescine transport system ATP-binding protein